MADPQQDKALASQLRAKDPEGFKDWTDDELVQAAKDKAANEPKSAVASFIQKYWKQVNPINIAKGLYETATTPIPDLVAGITQSSLQEAAKARDGFASGNPGEAIQHAVGAVPFVGGPIAESIGQGREGDYGGMLGTLAGVATLAAAPELAGKLPVMARIPAVLRNPSAMAAQAVDTGLAEGTQIPLGVASGKKWVQRMDLLGDSTSATGIFRNPEARAAEDLTKMAATRAEQIRPGGSVTRLEAGDALKAATDDAIQTFKRQSKAAGGQLETRANANIQQVPVTEVDPVTGKSVVTIKDMASPVNMLAAKRALQPVLERLNSDPTYTVTRKASDPGYTAISNIVNGPDFVPLTTALENQSAIGEMSRASGEAGSMTKGEALAGQGYKALNQATRQTAAALGNDAGALLDERQFNWKKAKDRERLSDEVFGRQTQGRTVEPAQAISKLLSSGDTQIKKLQKMSAVVGQDQMSNIGRAWFEDLVGHATNSGGFSRQQLLTNAWDNMGDMTKKVLFPDQAVRTNLQDFFTLQKMIMDKVNPSGTGGVNAVFQMANKLARSIGPSAGAYAADGGTGLGALQAILTTENLASYSPTVVKALTQGLIPLRTPARLAAVTGALSLAAPSNRPPNVVPSSPQTRGTAVEATDQVWELGPDGKPRRVQ